MNTLDQEHYYLVTYAQNREDLYIRAIFGTDYKGFYVDIGSNHPIHHSVTKLLYRSGWHGINVDPNRELMELTEYDRPRDTQLRCGVGAKAGKLTFRQYRNHGLSTFSKEMQQEYSGQSSEFTDTFEDIEVQVRTLKDIFTEYKVKSIDLLKVDVEGYEQEVLSGNDWKLFRPKVICIEANHKVQDWHNFLERQGYSVKTTDGLNDYYVDSSCDLANLPVQFAETVTIFPHVVDNDVASLIELQKLRVESSDIVSRAMRQPNRKASVRLLKETIRLCMRELKFLVKEHSQPVYDVYSPQHVTEAPKDLGGLATYVRKTEAVYTESYKAIRNYEQSQLPKSRSAGIAKRIKLAGYDTPRLVLGESGKVARRRMK